MEHPRNLRTLNKPAYTPQLVSIGPLHYRQKELKPMQKHKLRYLDLFRVRVENNIKALDKFKAYLRSKEEDICQCYAEKLNVEGEKLVDMMILDSVFIMELLLRVQEKQTHSDDIILKQSWLNKTIQRDLLLLENQIPLFILQELYNFVVPASHPAKKAHQTLVDLARDYFDSLRTYKKGDEETGSSEPKHFTDLIRSFYICKDLGPFRKGSPLRTATKLRESGVSFEKKVEKRRLLDIKFERVPILHRFLCLGCIPHSSYFKARLQIPQLKVDYTTECVLRNLIAFEQCHCPDEPYICNYVSFIDSLIHTKDDVELLVEKEVIVHELGSHKEVATLVNGLCKHVVADKTCYRNLINDLNKHYQRQWNKTMAALRLVYFRDAWRASSTLVATAVLVFTIFNFCRVVRLVLELEGGYKKP